MCCLPSILKSTVHPHLLVRAGALAGVAQEEGGTTSYYLRQGLESVEKSCVSLENLEVIKFCFQKRIIPSTLLFYVRGGGANLFEVFLLIVGGSASEVVTKK